MDGRRSLRSPGAIVAGSMNGNEASSAVTIEMASPSADRSVDSATSQRPSTDGRLTVRVRADDSATKPSLTIEDQGMLSPTNSTIFDRQVRDAGLELFEMDPLVDVLVLKKMANQRDAPESPREGDDVGLTSVRIKKGAKLGTLMGVFIPCLQNILGIIFYIRMSWIIGMAGVGQSLGLIALCCSCTFLTGLSLSAIATNGAMKGGGPYFLIGRALGPEVGVSIGLCFFFGNAVAASMYILGAVETILNAIPDMALFGATTTQVDTNLTMPDAVHNITSHVKSPNLHDLQVYGIIITILLCLIVFGGVKILASVGPLFLIPVLLSVVLIFIGMFVSPRDGQPDDVTGIRWSTFVENWDPAYQRTNSNGIPARDGIMNWAFRDLVGLFFPAVTGIMAGSNRSASLKDTQRSIPVGTLGAITSTTFMYFFATFMFGAVATRHRLLTDRLFTATVAWPVPGVVSLGIILSTLGAALQSLSGAPRLLSAIANDDILPVLNFFKAPDGSEPHWATVCTLFICIGCVCIGNLDLITPIITMFFLLCYCGVNLSCFLLDLLDAPSWRPRWKIHHWMISLLGALMCIFIMFLISWVVTIIALILASLIYYYVSLKGKAGDWGDGFKSAYFQLALRSLRSLGAKQVHPKNWYPIPVIFCKPWNILPNDVPCHPKLADFAICMKKKGRGMSIFVTVMEGDFEMKAEEARQAQQRLNTFIEYKKCEGVAEVVTAPKVKDGFRAIVQVMGLGNLKPNIVCMRYPEVWREPHLDEVPDTFVSIIKDCNTANKACVIVKGLDNWPAEYEKQYGTVDLYWIVRDGGLILLLSQLLRAKAIFENCKLQVFCIAEEDSEAEELKADAKKFLYDLRMQADVIVVTTKSWDDNKDASFRKEDALEAFDKARARIIARSSSDEWEDGTGGLPEFNVDEESVKKFLYTTLKLNQIMLRYSKVAALVMISLPPPPANHPAYCYMEYIDLLVHDIPRLLMVRGYQRDVVTIYS